MQSPNRQKKLIINALKFAGLCVLLLWSVHLFGILTDNSFSHLGIYPRKTEGIKGIFLAPLVHDNFEHLLSNTFPFFVLTGVIYYFYPKVAAPSFGIIYVLTGFIVWLFARPVYHIGASGVVYGLLSFVMFSGFFRKNLKAIVLALSVTVLYSGYFYGLLPLKDDISWESHLFGAMVGTLTAYIFKGVIEEDEIPKAPSWANEISNQEYFLPRDTFHKTKAERLIEKQMEEQRRMDEWRRSIDDGGSSL